MEQQQLQNELNEIKPLLVRDDITKQAAIEEVLKLKTIRKNIVEYWSGPKKKAHEAHKEITAKEKEMLTKVDGVINGIDREVTEYVREQRRIQLVEEEKTRKEAEKKAEEKRKKLKEEAEKKLEEGRLDEAVEIEEKAEEIEPEPIDNVVPMIPTMTKTESGSAHERERLVVEIIDLASFFAYCYDEKIISQLWQPMFREVKKYVKENKLKDVPGLNIERGPGIVYGTK